MEHTLVIKRNQYVGGFDGHCECLDPDWSGEHWSGYVSYRADTEADIIDQHQDHLTEAGVDV